MRLKIYHNPKCKQSRLGLEKLKTITNNIEIRDYLKTPITTSELNEIVLKLNLPIGSLVGTNDEYYKTFLKGKNFNHDEWIKIICENPKLLKRPIIVGHYKAIVGHLPEEIEKIK